MLTIKQLIISHEFSWRVIHIKLFVLESLADLMETTMSNPKQKVNTAADSNQEHFLENFFVDFDSLDSPEEPSGFPGEYPDTYGATEDDLSEPEFWMNL